MGFPAGVSVVLQHVSQLHFPTDVSLQSASWRGGSTPSAYPLSRSSHLCCSRGLPDITMRLFTLGFAKLSSQERREQPKAQDASSDLHSRRSALFLRSRQIVTPPFKISWKLDVGLIMQEAKFQHLNICRVYICVCVWGGITIKRIYIIRLFFCSVLHICSI